jgi:hypothetical protein
VDTALEDGKGSSRSDSSRVYEIHKRMAAAVKKEKACARGSLGSDQIDQLRIVGKPLTASRRDQDRIWISLQGNGWSGASTEL